MFNVGGMELVVICLVALIVLGPEKLPGAIRQVGRVTGELRRISQGFQADFRTALAEAEREADAETSSRSGPARTEVGAGEETEVRPVGPDPRAAMAAAQSELEALTADRSDVEDPPADDAVADER